MELRPPPLDEELKHLFTKTLVRDDMVVGLALVGDSYDYLASLPRTIYNEMVTKGLQIRMYPPNQRMVTICHGSGDKSFKLLKNDWSAIVKESGFEVGDKIACWACCHDDLGGNFSLLIEKVIPNLEELSLKVKDAAKVCQGQFLADLFHKDEAIKLTQLRTLTLEYLPQFTSVSSKSNAASMSQTRPEPLITDVRSNEIASDTGLRTPMTLFNRKIECPNLEDLKLSSIEVEKIWQDQPGELSYWFVRLTSLIVQGCRNLKYLFTTSMVESLAQLKRLELCDCVSMEEIIIKNKLGEEENARGMMLPKLEFLKLKGLPNLTRFCTGHLIQCCFLQELWIEDCPALKTFISNSLSTDAVANNQFEETNSTLCP